jgi:hypothetical protein
MNWACLVPSMGQVSSEYKIQIGKYTCRWYDIIKISLKEIGWEGVGWSYLSQDRGQWWALVNISGPLDPTEGGEFLFSWATVNFWGSDLLRAVSSVPEQTAVEQCFETSVVCEDVALFCMPYWEIHIADSSLKMEAVVSSEMLIPIILQQSAMTQNTTIWIFMAMEISNLIYWKFFQTEVTDLIEMPLLHENFLQTSTETCCRPHKQVHCWNSVKPMFRS